MKQFGRVACVACALAINASFAISHRALGEERDLAASNPLLSNVVAAFESLPTEGRLLQFKPDVAAIARGGHFQGIQLRFDAGRNRNVAFLSHDSETIAYLVVAQFPAGLSGDGRAIRIHTLPSDGKSPPLRHGGGIQLVGDILVIGLEDNQQKTRSEIQFWNVSNPDDVVQLKHLTIRRSGEPKDKTAGAVGMVQREKDHRLAVANWDSRAIDFYVSNGKPLDDPQCQFLLDARWQVDLSDKRGWKPDRAFGAYQSINLVSDTDRNLFLIGFHTDSGNKDLADLFSIDPKQVPSRLLQKLASKQIKLQGDNHFQFSGGVWIDRDKLGILSSERDFGPAVRINVAMGEK